jgi:hypothetical protein
MITLERIKSFLDKQYLACNSSTLMSLYVTCKDMSAENSRLFLKQFYESQLDKHGKEGLLERWYVQEGEIASKLLAERKMAKESMGKGVAHVCMPNSVRYGPERLQTKYHK